MVFLLFATITSFFIHALLIVPFINLLYRIKFQRAEQKTKDAFNKRAAIFDRFNAHKVGTPVGGGILVVAVTTILFTLCMYFYSVLGWEITANYTERWHQVFILIFTFISFAILGLYDDIHKIFFIKRSGFFGIRMRHKFIVMIILALIIAYWMYSVLGISFVHIPFFGVVMIGEWYILFAAFVIVAFANAVNITDGLDGLASGLLMIALASFWVIAGSILDVPTSILIACWMGGLIAFLYFNVTPARIFLGDAGALSFGATFAVVGLMLGKAFALPIIGGVFVIEILSSLLQLTHKRFTGKKLFPVAPLHLYMQLRGWEEPKIVMRLWIIGILFALLGLMFAFVR